jgi:hypothetical protein
VSVCGEDGRLERGIARPGTSLARNVPTRGTWITFYASRPGLRAPHQFDVSDNRLYESCKRTYRGEPAHTRLWEDDLIEL